MTRLRRQLALLLPLLVIPAAGAAAAPLTLDQLRSELSGRVDELAQRDLFSGVVLVAKDGEVVAEKCGGLADRRQETPVTPTTRFDIGSINKVFTRIVVQTLAARGQLALDDPISKHLPDYPDREIAAKVTLRQLLDMTSGLGDIFGDEFDATPRNRLVGNADYLRLFAGRPLEFEPGSSKRYSNAGYMVLGMVIEKVTQARYEDVVADSVFAPAGMHDALFVSTDEVRPRLATGYTRPEAPALGELRANTFAVPYRGTAAGGAYATARDLLAFDQAMRRGVFREAGIEGGGLGVAGGAPGVNALLESHRESGWTVVVLANLDPPAALGMVRAVNGWLEISD